jgi:hypothetical protein
MSSWQKGLSLPVIAVALGMFSALSAVLYLPAVAQPQVCADDVARFRKGVGGHFSESLSPSATIPQLITGHTSSTTPVCDGTGLE